jgi:tRNA(Arg) A34 adenosine deaminase TadA
MSKRHNITAIIYDRKGKILSIGKNSYIKTHPMQAKFAAQVGEAYKVFLHAEIHAITRCKKLSKAYSMTITRFNEDGSPALAKPCKICNSALKFSGIKFVRHT